MNKVITEHIVTKGEKWGKGNCVIEGLYALVRYWQSFYILTIRL